LLRTLVLCARTLVLRCRSQLLCRRTELRLCAGLLCPEVLQEALPRFLPSLLPQEPLLRSELLRSLVLCSRAGLLRSGTELWL
jgi:hypothetical protein